MEIYKLQPLSASERELAEVNHGLVYSFLHQHGYSLEDTYSIVIFGYLKGVQVYNRRKDLQRYKLSSICYQYMRSEIGNHYKMENSQKRKHMEELLSLDAEYSEMENLYNAIGRQSVEVEYIETEKYSQVMETFNQQQRKIVELKMDGYSNSEICALMEMPSSTYYKEINRIKTILESLIIMENK